MRVIVHIRKKRAHIMVKVAVVDRKPPYNQDEVLLKGKFLSVKAANEAVDTMLKDYAPTEVKFENHAVFG